MSTVAAGIALDVLADGLRQLGIVPAEAMLRQLADYAALLGRWNHTYNLTSVRDPERIVPLHLLDSAAIVHQVGAGSLLDVGSGAGLPGIPLAVLRPELPVTLLDAVSKKSAFQRQAVIELGLGNVSVACGRVESYRPERAFDQIVSRAFAGLDDFVGGTDHLLASGGRWLAMKGQDPGREISNLPGSVAVEAVLKLDVPGVEGERHLVVMKKR